MEEWRHLCGLLGLYVFPCYLISIEAFCVPFGVRPVYMHRLGGWRRPTGGIGRPGVCRLVCCCANASRPSRAS
jgi:hypothetical protein